MCTDFRADTSSAGGTDDCTSSDSPPHRVAELVKEIATSGTQATRRRRNAASKVVRRALKEQGVASAGRLRAFAMTLTYADNADFDSQHISRFIRCFRQMLKRRGHVFPYLWTLERESRFHYHLTVWLPRDFPLDKDTVKKWWQWGSTWIESCRHVKAWGKYITKFDSLAEIPKGVRIYGYGGLNEDGKTAVHRAALPLWLRLLLPPGERVRRISGVGRVSCATGEVYQSPYVWTPRRCILRSASPPPLQSSP